ncbi:hypothetical protein LOD99_16116 [Oopsacas minuta]|uniref:GDP-fucose protein O-fucosyltransferase 2 n=1 Tax=Oopsacas minuta TaxID=111878 RepID=A0AAV7K7R6_9METZ|nr:hypothetical protein LOD99_16116 [Oopsacas minuta]
MKIIHRQVSKYFKGFIIFSASFIVFAFLSLRYFQSLQVLHYGTYSAVRSGEKFLSYQPGGQGWNNQRIALEHAVVFAKLLNRTLILQPVSEHPLGQDMVGKLKINGYEAYNLMKQSNLLPISRIIDLHHLSNFLPVIENVKPHPEFIREFSHFSRTDICHSVAYGFWVDRRAETEREKSILEDQFFREKNDMLGKCKQSRITSKANKYVPIVKYIFPDLLSDQSDILYFSEGTFFAIDVRFFNEDSARAAQYWISHYIRYNPGIITTVDKFTSELPSNYCCIHARRTFYHRSYLTWQYFLRLTDTLGCNEGRVLYIATDLLENEFFDHFNSYKLINATSLTPYINFNNIPPAFHQTYLGIHEQLVCVHSSVFVPSNHSTLSYYVHRVRGEVPQIDGLLIKHIYFYFIEHYVDKIISKFYIKKA